MAEPGDAYTIPGTTGGFGRTDEELATLPQPYAADLFRGKVAVISGAGSGIGRATAHWLARLGADVVICGRKPEKLQSAAEALRRYGGRVVAKTLSIRDPDAVSGLFAEAWSELGRVDLLVNNAGGQFPQPAIDFSPKGWNAVIDTNLNGTWYMMQAAARKWRDANQPGCVVNVIANIWRGLPGIAHACAARAGVAYLSKTVAIEWAPLRIRVNCIAPGIVATEGMGVYSPEAVREYPNTNLVRRFARVEEIASAICFLGSELSSFMTGEVLSIDGGNQLWGDQWTIPRPEFFQV